MDADELGRVVREAWVEWAREQPDPKPSWLVPWEGLPEPDREADRRIGQAVLGHILHRRLLITDEHEDAPRTNDSLAEAVAQIRDGAARMLVSPQPEWWGRAFAAWSEGCDRVVGVALALVPDETEASAPR